MGPHQTEAAIEISFVLAARVLEWTSAAFLFAWRGASIAALFRPEDTRCGKSTRRDNRSARVLATPKIVCALTANKSQTERAKEWVIKAGSLSDIGELKRQGRESCAD